jgi:hypothetical protein
VQKSAFSRPRHAHNRDHFAGLDFEIEILKKNQFPARRAIRLAQSFHPNQRSIAERSLFFAEWNWFFLGELGRAFLVERDWFSLDELGRVFLGSGRPQLLFPRGAGCLRGSRWRGMHHPVDFILQDAPRGAFYVAPVS